MWLQILIGIFLILHGMVHWVYAAPQDKAADAKAFSVLTGRWLVKKGGLDQSIALKLGIALMILATVGFAVSGIGVLTSQDWWGIPAIATAAVSTLFLALYWDKMMTIGVVLNIGIIMLALFWNFQAN
ncbi:MAG: hypothetical protein A2Z76_02270 [Chloroflexi bacterium RBG_13_56_8b]|nr:MAG: hypothetical protein A2Z76_02270 [Chloroflexi bacterium RBG_13_56_8b]